MRLARTIQWILPAAAYVCLTLGQGPRATVFEGARLIVGDGTAIENSAFVVEGTQFTRVGRRGQVQIPAGATRVDLTGKTIIPAKVDLHGHIGFQHDFDGTMAKEYYTRENLIDHLERMAYYGVGGVIGIADLMDRADLRGSRTNWGDAPIRVRDEMPFGAALFLTAGPGIAWPGSGAQGHPSRADVPYPVTTPSEARAAVQDNARMKPAFIKIWVDDRGGQSKKLTPELYLPIIEEAHKLNLPVAAHNVTLADAKILMRAGVEGWVHLPVRNGEVPDEELLSIIRTRVAKQDRPKMWFHPNVGSSAFTREDWNDPLLRETVPPEQIQQHWGEQLARTTPESVARARESLRQLGATNALKLRAAGMKIVLGSDTGQIRFFIGWMGQLEFENWVWMGLTPMEAIVAATRDSAEAAHLNTGLIAQGKNADFTVLDANPLENIANSRKISRVFLRGQEVDRAALRARWQSRWRK
jgi:imidazolonepropionase-like amidohydrolase